MGFELEESQIKSLVGFARVVLEDLARVHRNRSDMRQDSMIDPGDFYLSPNDIRCWAVQHGLISTQRPHPGPHRDFREELWLEALPDVHPGFLADV